MIRRVLRRVVHTLRKRLGPSVNSVQGLRDLVFLERVELASPSKSTVDDLLRHFGERVGDDWPEIPDELTDLRIDLSRMTDKEIIQRADAALTGDLHPSGKRPRLNEAGLPDWSYNPAQSREWLLMLHRHAWWPLWGAAYRVSGDEKYARAFVEQLDDWIAKHPLPKYKSEHSEAWRLMETGLRMRISWIPSFGCFYEAEAFSDEAKFRMLRAIYDHGQFLQTFYTNRNHLLRESNGLLATGLGFPEFDRAEQWVEAATTRIESELHSQVNRDGSHLEMSIGYQWLTVIEFEVTRSLLHRHGRTAAIQTLDDALRRMYEFLAAVIRPDRSFPQLNDGFILWDAAKLESIARERGWADIEYVASTSMSGTHPDFCSRSYPNAGLHIMRSDWSADARYLVLDTGPYGGPHGHEDKLSFELSAYGARFIVDPGSYTYSSDDPDRNYFVGSQGHNTVLVDAGSQVRRWNPEHMTPAVADVEHGAWRSDEKLDVACGQYDEGYAPFSITGPGEARITTGVSHQRAVVFARPDYWVVVDTIESREAHDYTFLYHLAPDVTVVETAPQSAIIRSESNGALLVLQVLTDQVIQGEVVEGWYSADHYKKCPAPVLSFTAKKAPSSRFVWLLYPLPAGSDAGHVMAKLEYGPDGVDERLVIRSDKRADKIQIPGRANDAKLLFFLT